MVWCSPSLKVRGRYDAAGTTTILCFAVWSRDLHANLQTQEFCLKAECGTCPVSIAHVMYSSSIWYTYRAFLGVHPFDCSLRSLYAEACAGYKLGHLFLVVDQAQAMAGRQLSTSQVSRCLVYMGDKYLRREQEMLRASDRYRRFISGLQFGLEVKHMGSTTTESYESLQPWSELQSTLLHVRIHSQVCFRACPKR